MKKLVIFDLDGTLLNSVADLAQATNHALRLNGYPTHPTDAYRFFVGNGINKLFERALPEGEKTQENVLRIRKDFIPYYNAHNRDYTRPYDGIEELLHTLQARGVMMAIASNKYIAATLQLVPAYFGDIQFACVLGHREGIAPKPDPRIVYDILEQTGVAKNDVLYVGDTCVDMQTARNAGLTSVGVTWGFRPQCELEDEGACHIIDHPSELLPLVGL